jgi:regulator of RNase E activity RraA
VLQEQSTLPVKNGRRRHESVRPFDEAIRASRGICMLAPDLLERVATVDVAALCDANKDIRVMDPSLRPVTSFRQMVGRARTVRCRDDFLTVIQALCDSEPGEVLVVDGGGGTRALPGELFATEAVRRKLAGIVIDGACRDTAKLSTLHLPLSWLRPLRQLGSSSGVSVVS